MTAMDIIEDRQCELSHMVTESSNPALAELDVHDTLERLQLMNAEDQLVAKAVRHELSHIAVAIHHIVHSFRCGGRLIYIGAGSSGRMGVLDASECPPTFGTEPGLVTAIIAGGPSAMFEAVEGAEDDPLAGIAAMEQAKVCEKDTVVGISASGQAPFVLGAIAKAKEVGAYTVGLANNRSSKLCDLAAVSIAVIVGPEVIAGSTRMKAGTAQKMVLNLLSTNAMIEFGKTYGNLMVDVKATNTKLRMRAQRITCEVTGASEEVAALTLAECAGSAKLAILVLETGLTVHDASILLEKNNGFLRRAMQQHDRTVKFD